MITRLSQLALLLGSMVLFSSCANTETPPRQQTPAFGEPVSTIPWNQPQRWEGNAGGLNAIRGNEEGY